MADNRGIRRTLSVFRRAAAQADQDVEALRSNRQADVNRPDRALSRFADGEGRVAQRSDHANDVQALTLNTTQAARAAVGAAAESLATEAGLAERQQRTRAQQAWLRDITKESFSEQTEQKAVLDHVALTRRLKESGEVLSTLNMAATFSDFPADFTLVRRRGSLEGLMQSTHFADEKKPTDRTPNMAIGFLSTHPQNIATPPRTKGVGTAMIRHAEHLAVGHDSITLGAQGKDAQGFYKHMGFQHADGRRLSSSEFIDGTLPLRLPLRRG